MFITLSFFFTDIFYLVFFLYRVKGHTFFFITYNCNQNWKKSVLPFICFDIVSWYPEETMRKFFYTNFLLSHIHFIHCSETKKKL